jgi:hypothetical protein
LALSDEKMMALTAEQENIHQRLNASYHQMLEGGGDGRFFARDANATINASLRRLEGSLGKEDFERFFDWKVGQEIELVDPEAAAFVQYRK